MRRSSSLQNIDTIVERQIGSDKYDDIVAVGRNIDEVVAVSGALADIATSNANIADVTAVAGNINNVNTVASGIAAVNAVAGNASNVNTVAGSIANVNDVGNNILDVTLVAGGMAAVEVVSADLLSVGSAIETVAASIGSISTVAGSMPNVNIVANGIASVNANAANISAVAEIAADVVDVASIVTDVTTVANSIANVNSVALNNSNISLVANSIVPSLGAILAADDYANTASTQAGIAITQASIAAQKATEAAANVVTARGYASDAMNFSIEASEQAAQASSYATSAHGFANDAEAAKVAAQLAYDQFDDRYLGSKTGNPLTDNDGGILQVGAIYWNSNTKSLRVYDGVNWNDPVRDAEAAMEAAENSSTAASLSESNAIASAISAGVSEAKAYKWAEEAIDTPVIGTIGIDAQYSAKHWATKAAEFVGGNILLNNLQDVDTTGILDAQVLRYDALGAADKKWVPHTMVKADIGLGNVDNTSDLDKPLSTAATTALNLKVDKVTGSSLIPDTKVTSYDSHLIDTNNPHNTTAAQVGAYTTVQTDALLSTKADLVGGKIPAAQLPSYVDDVLEYANLAAFPVTGETGKIYVALDTNFSYRWSGTAYIDITGKVDSVNGQTGVVILNANNIEINKIGTPTHVVNLQTQLNYAWSAGLVNGGELTNNGNGTVSIAESEAMLRISADAHTTLNSVVVPAYANMVLTDNATNYIYADYNAGAPTYAVSTSTTAFNCLDKCIAWVVSREGTELHVIDAREQNVDSNTKTRRLFLDYQTFIHAQGGTVLGANGLALTVTAGKFYFMVKSIEHGAFDTTVAGTAVANVFRSYYRNSTGGWVKQIDQKVINTTLWDNGTGTLATISNNKYGVHWVYVILNNPSYLVTVYGQGDYATFAEAQAALAPSSLPQAISGTGVLIGRVIFVKGATSFAAIESAFLQSFTSSSATNHNTLAGLQGGSLNDYYHLTNVQHTALTDGGDTTLHTHDNRYYTETEINTLFNNLNVVTEWE